MTVQSGDPRGVVTTLLCALSYGLAPPMVRLAYEAGAGILTATSVRFLGGVFGVAVVLAIGRRAIRLNRRANWGALFLGVLSTVTSFGYMASVMFIPASLAVLIFYLFPLIVAIGARWTDGEPVTWPKLVGLGFAFAGLAVALGVNVEQIDLRGVALAGLGAVGAAAHVLAIRRVVRLAEGAILPLTLRSAAVGLAANLVLLFAYGGPVWPSGTAGWLGLIGMMIFFTLGVILMYAAVSRLGPVRASILLNFEPLVAIVTAVLLLGETFGLHQIAGAAMVLGAVLWVQFQRLG